MRVRELLRSVTRHVRWAGADLLHTTSDRGHRHTVVIETNSSPSGQKSMPFDDSQDQSSYQRLMERSFLPMLRRRGLPSGDVAVLCDKNPMETRGYAAVLADILEREVWWVPWKLDDPEAPAEMRDGVLYIRDDAGDWHPIRAALKYITQRPWARVPPVSKTAFFNSPLVCLAGGRNKLLAAKAYDIFNADLRASRLELRTPETIWDVEREEVPLWIERMGGVAVVKVPYSNAGQGVYTIANRQELDSFMDTKHPYDLFIVQAMVGNLHWSSQGRAGRLYHLGTVPNRHGQIFAADLRVMVGCGVDGFFPVAIYARRARKPLISQIDTSADSWDMLGTNLSVKLPDGTWTTEPERLLLMDSRDFNKLGIGLDDLIEGYMQTVMAVTAIDRMASRLVTKKGMFRKKMFDSLNPDPALRAEITT